MSYGERNGVENSLICMVWNQVEESQFPSLETPVTPT